MPRTPRLDYAEARHHVMNRTAGRGNVFHTDAECAIFVDALSELPERFGVRVHGYALMPDHYHLLISTPQANLSRAMRHLGAVVTQRLNQLHQTDGPVFRGRFKNRVVESDDYWRHLLVYLHNNPVQAGLARRVQDCLWTSHLSYVADRGPGWLTVEEHLGLFGGVAEYLNTLDELRVGRREAPESFDESRLWIGPSTAPESAISMTQATPDAVLKAVAAICAPADLELATPGIPNPARWLATWALTRHTDLTQAQIAKRFGVSRGRISQQRTQLFQRAAADPTLRGWIDEVSDLRL